RRAAVARSRADGRERHAPPGARGAVPRRAVSGGVWPRAALCVQSDVLADRVPAAGFDTSTGGILSLPGADATGGRSVTRGLPRKIESDRIRLTGETAWVRRILDDPPHPCDPFGRQNQRTSTIRRATRELPTLPATR